MARPKRLESRSAARLMAGLLSAVLHLGLLLMIVLSGGRWEGIHDDDTPVIQVVLFDARVADQRDGIERAPWKPSIPAPALSEPPDLQAIEPPSLLIRKLEIPPEDVQEIPPVEVEAALETALTSAVEPLATFVMPRAQASALLRRIEQLAEDLTKSPRARVSWSQDGRQYDADLVLEPASTGVEPDRVIAEISAEDRGRQLRTRIMLKRLPFSHFTQVIDRWDPMVQLHDDEIVGRMHINSRFNLLYDSQARPRLRGKVSTAASGFDVESRGRGRASDVFRDGIETRAGKIALSAQVHWLEWARRNRSARIYELEDDTRIRFFADGSYSWRDPKSGTSQYGGDPSGQPVYFIAARGVTVYVQGVVSGQFLVYSPQRIVVEGDLTYARDPRNHPDSADYLGLVCDKDIEVAPPHVTGPGDLHIQAALFAKRRIIVTKIDHSRSATLAIYGSLAAGSLTASEPRYATRVEYDPRFEQRRPPGFPSTDRFAAEEWDGRWTEVSETPQTGAF